MSETIPIHKPIQDLHDEFASHEWNGEFLRKWILSSCFSGMPQFMQTYFYTDLYILQHVKQKSLQ